MMPRRRRAVCPRRSGCAFIRHSGPVMERLHAWLRARFAEKGVVGDLFMSPIHTCELNGANAFDYLIELQKHAQEVAENPSAWMPWNCQEVLAQADTEGKGD